MQKNFGQNDPKIVEYVEKVFTPEDAILREVRVRSEKEGLPLIQVGDVDALHLEVLARAIGAERVVEIGTLGGYSGISIARALPADGKLYTFEFEPHHAKVAAESFKKAGLADRIEIFVGAALDNLHKITDKGPFDLVFIDADKENYPNYLNWAAENLRKGGVILADNTFGFGFIAEEEIDPEFKESVLALRKFNERLAQDGRFRATILPTGEGLAMGVKK